MNLTLRLGHFYNQNLIILFNHSFQKLHDIEAIKVESDIRILVDQVDVIVSGLKSTSEKGDDLFSRYLTYHVTRHLDLETVKDWDNSLTFYKSFLTYSQLQKFLQNCIFTAEERAADFKSFKWRRESKDHAEKFEKKAPKKKLSSVIAAVASKIKCVRSDKHYLNQCASFTVKSVNERFDIDKKNHLCLKCFNTLHSVAECKRNNCSLCNDCHNQLLYCEVRLT